jgi:hypothetical protein
LSSDPTPTAPATSPLVAYHDAAFMEGDGGRALRILAEYLQPLQRFQRLGVRDTVVFFGSARLAPDGPLGRYDREARELAGLVTAWSKSLPARSTSWPRC